MVEQQTTWPGGRTARTTTRARPTLRPRLRVNVQVHPLQIVLRYRLVSATVMVSIALLMYLFQVNQGAWIDFRLSEAKASLTQENAVMAGALVRKDDLFSASRVDTIAITHLHMKRSSLKSALWLTVELPKTVPHPAQEPIVKTGPLPWLRHALGDLEAAL